MKLAPPPGSRVIELGDRLIVRIGPHASRGELVLGAVWLAIWTGAGIFAAVAVAREDSDSRAGLAFWLCMWATIEFPMIVSLAWNLVGRELLILTPQQLEVRMELGRLSRTKRYDVALVRDVQGRVVPSSEDEGRREDFGLRIAYGLDSFHVGEGMDEREADELAAAIRARIKPRSWWEDDDRPDPAVPLVALGEPSPWPQRLRVVVSAVVLVSLVAAAVYLAQDPRRRSTPPATGEVRDGAAAATRSLLAVGGTRVLGQPACGERVTPEKWTCTVRAYATTGPFAGRTMTYRCSRKSRGGRILCGPHPPPRIGSPNQPPRAEDYSDPRDWASAMTRYSLRSAHVTVLGKPDCGEEVGWEAWSCTASGRSKDGPFAGRTLAYRCFLTDVRWVAGRVVGSSTQCGPANPPPIGG